MSDGRAALLLIETRRTTVASSGVPSCGWVWSGEPEFAAAVAVAVITHPDLVAFFADVGVLLQLGHRVLTQREQWGEIRDDIDTIWNSIETGGRAHRRIEGPATKWEAELRTLRLPRGYTEAGFKYRDFQWRRPGSTDGPICSTLKSAVGIAAKRNTAVAGIASTLQRADPVALRAAGIPLSEHELLWLRTETRRIVVVVESTEHADVLQSFLPAWPILSFDRLEQAPEHANDLALIVTHRRIST